MEGALGRRLRLLVGVEGVAGADGAAGASGVEEWV
jgi:hypothetical protein